MLLKLNTLRQKLAEDSALANGCIIDTNVLFAATFELDPFNDWAEEVFNELNSLKIPIFTNINIRSEFIELNRRVLIPYGLRDLYETWGNELDPKVEHSLKSLKTRMKTALDEGKVFKISDAETKRYRVLLNEHARANHLLSWDGFCEVHFRPYITKVWDKAISMYNVQSLGTREIETKKYFNENPKWIDMVDIVGRTGIGTSDAMIINLFLKSKLPLIVTADADVRDSVASMMPKNKFILAPH
ncbi:MAG: hypothetical protein KA715_10900 [Xanthomonadaceae bacterium]|nr:hypothetical protein [Xanthomonadaceae bacterium]